MAILDTISQAWTFISALPMQVWAIVGGLLISWGGTQAIKFQLDGTLTDEQHKKRVRLWAVVLGLVPSFVLWPKHSVQDYLNALMFAACVGVSSPIAYIYVMKILYHFFPWLEAKVSARPVIRYDADGNAAGIRMDPTDPNDHTVYFKKPDQTVPKDSTNNKG